MKVQVNLSPGAETHSKKMIFEPTTHLEKQKQNRKINTQEETIGHRHTLCSKTCFFPAKHSKSKNSLFNAQVLVMAQTDNGKSLVFRKTGAYVSL